MNLYIGNLTTEQINKDTKNIDLCDTEAILKMINNEDKHVAEAVESEIPNITMAVDVIVEHFKAGGRLFYVGAGTSGRLGVLDASECPPTFGTDSEMVQGIIAGGDSAMYVAIEGAEDDVEAGKRVIYDYEINKNDVVVGITASGRTPFVIGTVEEAKSLGIATIGVSNTSTSLIKEKVDIAITPVVGPEVLMGSTRMKAGTAQKLVLNMLTTASMIKIGKVYGNLMVDLKPTNSKLVDRAERIVCYATGVDEKTAKKYLKETENNPKIAIVMIKTGCDRISAEELLSKEDGFVTRAINNGLRE